MNLIKVHEFDRLASFMNPTATSVYCENWKQHLSLVSKDICLHRVASKAAIGVAILKTKGKRLAALPVGEVKLNGVAA